MENEINNFIKAVLHTEEGNKPIILSMKEKLQTKTILEKAEENWKVKKKTHTKKEKNKKNPAKTFQKLLNNCELHTNGGFCNTNYSCCFIIALQLLKYTY